MVRLPRNWVMLRDILFKYWYPVLCRMLQMWKKLVSFESPNIPANLHTLFIMVVSAEWAFSFPIHWSMTSWPLTLRSLSFPLPLTFMLIWLPLHKERTIYGFERSFSLRKECFEGIRTHVLSRSTSSIYPHGYSVFNSDHLAIIYENWLRSLYYRWQWRCTCMLSTKRIVRGWELVTWLLV